MHVPWSVSHEPFHALNHDEPRQKVAIEGVKEEHAGRAEHACGLGDRLVRVLDVFQKVHGADDVERGVSERQLQRVTLMVAHFASSIVPGRDRECIPRGVETRHPMPQRPEMIG